MVGARLLASINFNASAATASSLLPLPLAPEAAAGEPLPVGRLRVSERVLALCLVGGRTNRNTTRKRERERVRIDRKTLEGDSN